LSFKTLGGRLSLTDGSYLTLETQGGASGIGIHDKTGVLRFSILEDGSNNLYLRNELAIGSQIPLEGLANGQTSFSDISLAGTVRKMNGASTTGMGVPAVYGGSATINLSAAFQIVNFTPPVGSANGTYRTHAFVDVTAWTTPASFSVQLVYKNGTGNSRTETLPFWRATTGTWVTTITAIDRYYSAAWLFNTDTSQTPITIATVGTFTGSLLYNFGAILEQLA
jgi:hypothetical protein